MKVYIARHAESNSNMNGIPFNSQINDNISEEGKKQALNLAKRLRDKNISKIFVSCSLRTFETANVIKMHLKTGIPIISDPRINECNFGVFEGKTFEEVKKVFPKQFEERQINKFQYEIPEGESYKTVYNRIHLFFQEIIKEDNVLIITHGTTLKLFLLLLTNKSLKDIELDYYRNTCLFGFDIERKNDYFFKAKPFIYNSVE